MVDPVKFFLSSSLITMQNLVAVVSYSVGVYRGPIKLGGIVAGSL